MQCEEIKKRGEKGNDRSVRNVSEHNKLSTLRTQTLSRINLTPPGGFFIALTIAISAVVRVSKALCARLRIGNA